MGPGDRSWLPGHCPVLEDSLKRHVAPDPLDAGEECFELEERRRDRVGSHWNRLYRKANRLGRRRRHVLLCVFIG